MRWCKKSRFPALGEVLTFFAQEHAAHVRVKVEGRRYCTVRSSRECCADSPALEESTLRKKGGDPRTDQTWKETTRTPGWQPHRGTKGRGPKDPSV